MLQQTSGECTFKTEIISCLKRLHEKIKKYFDRDFDTYKPLRWVQFPFDCHSLDAIDDSSFKEKEELISLQCDSNMKLDFQEKSLAEFWIARLQNLSSKAVATLTAFPTTWLCESAFSKINFMKSKERNLLDIKHDARTALSSTEPDIKALVNAMQTSRFN